ncbi:hypothetical protein AXF42_Ash002793 [Apostasia shenzhenica]|uniref:Uncharacterized protein n=1 Tax=Apostasia shenzhenica TaxID=1088818 RepID=A0A2I0A7B4_9ASPA|nr:hypothetical protein AXF42_Ash002793 [Apostasia shenzhenica]
MDAESPTCPLLAGDQKLAAAVSGGTTRSDVSDELLLRRLRASLRWCALDHSSAASRAASYLAFFTLALAVPAAATFLLPLPPTAGEEAATGIPFNALAQLPESALAAIAFLTFRCRRGLRQLLLVDGVLRDSPAVRQGYAREIDRAFRYLAGILLPSVSVELTRKSLLLSSSPAAAVVAVAAVASWLYRSGVFLLVCVLFRLTCELQILRFEELYRMFGEGGGGPASSASAASAAEEEEEEEERVEVVMMREHMRIRRQVRATSHEYRIFIICCLVTITVSQLGALMMVLASKGKNNFSNSGDLVVCSVVQLSGFLMCLFGAARITHRAQRVVSVATRWHVIMSAGSPTAKALHESDGCDQHRYPDLSSSQPSVLAANSSFESRQALVAYLQHNGGGITIFGFQLDRGLLHTLFAFEMTLVLWILSKVVVLS